ncbi:MAG: hypothetical protein LUD72_06410 [Bacteroidales bacterium]|nr:hypothetical protein [Bacteroidales bacterium]
MSQLFSKSDKFTTEYCISIVRIGGVKPIENSDFLGQTVVNGESIVIRKDQVKEGDVLFYASNECALNKDFLARNNLFEWSERDLNDNRDEVEKVRETDEEKAKRMVGFFNKHGRVRMIRLRGVPSMGYLFGLSEMTMYCPKVKDIDLEGLLGEDFDTVDGELFVKAYVPFVPQRRGARRNNNKRQKKVKRFDRLVKNEFLLHYDTDPLPKYIHEFKPDDEVTIDCKNHGTSLVTGNVKVKQPLRLHWYQWLWNKTVDLTGLFKATRITDYEVVYGNVYSSRNVIKNQYINQGIIQHFYGTDIWGEYNDLLKGIIPEGMTIYGEICGYVTGSRTYIQKDYDYGCREGENFLMPYRITTSNEDGTKKEWSVREVKTWTEQLVERMPELKDKVKPVTVLYEGTLRDMYPDLDTENHWHENLLEALRNDRKRLGMEEREPLCANNVPREGIVIRKENDPVAEAYKLKSQKFMNRERKQIDAGEVDMEMADGLTNEEG